jgi:hypothetical protein
MGLKPNWRTLTQAHSASSSPVPSATSTPHSTPLLSVSQKVSRRHTVSHDVGAGAFTDQGLFEDPSSLVAWRAKIPPQMVMIDGEGSDDEHKPQVAQKRRAPRSVVSDEKSLSIDTLPPWAKFHWKLQFVPSLIDVLGGEANPWDAEKNQGGEGFIDLLQQVVNAVYPEANYIVQKNCKIFRMVCNIFHITLDARSLFYHCVVQAICCGLAAQLL